MTGTRALCARAADLAAAAVRASPAALLTAQLRGIGAAPDPWQVRALSSTARRLAVVACRQVGKGSVAAALALHTALAAPGRLCLIVSASERQARIVLSRIRQLLPYAGPGAAGAVDTATEVRLTNGSRVVVLPASSTSLRGWTADLLVIDEAAYVSAAAWEAVVPTVSATGGAIVCLSSAGRPAGWFYEVVTDEETYPDWERFRVRHTDVARLDPEFIAAERRRLPAASFAREYDAEFTGDEAGVFDPATIDAAFTSNTGAGHLAALTNVLKRSLPQ